MSPTWPASGVAVTNRPQTVAASGHGRRRSSGGGLARATRRAARLALAPACPPPARRADRRGVPLGAGAGLLERSPAGVRHGADPGRIRGVHLRLRRPGTRPSAGHDDRLAARPRHRRRLRGTRRQSLRRPADRLPDATTTPATRRPPSTISTPCTRPWRRRRQLASTARGWPGRSVRPKARGRRARWSTSCLHINREAIHHLAEIALLRDLFAHR